jgi:RNA polymerase-binding transcription factor DksA
MAIDKKIVKELKGKLLNEKERIEKELASFANPSGTPGDYKTKFGDIGTDTDENASEVEEYTDNLALENALERKLKDISIALDKMEKGTYGICDNCHEEIGTERLQIYPAARTCMKCGKK